MTHRAALVATAALVALLAAAPTQAGVDWFGLHIGPAGVGLSLGFGSWGVHAASWSSWSDPLDYHSALAGYGEWVWVEDLGQVWRPWVAADWRPYTFGRWVWTSLGWTWVAYEPWGYFPHHYGSWALAPVGWVWRPGYSYTPANVIWVTSGPRIGWYACPPRGWSHAARGYHRGWRDGYRSGYRDGWEDARYASFVGWDRLGAEDLHRHAVVGHAVPRGHGATVLAAAPARDEVVRRGGRAVPEARLAQRSARIDGREVVMARPEGVSRSVERNAPETVRRALRPDVARQLESARGSRAVERGGAAPRAATRPEAAPSRSRSTVTSPSGTEPSRTERARRPAASPPPAPAAGSRGEARREPEARIAPAPATRVSRPAGAAAGPRADRARTPSRSAPAARVQRDREAARSATSRSTSAERPRRSAAARTAPSAGASRAPARRTVRPRTESRSAPSARDASRPGSARAESAARGRSSAQRRAERPARTSREGDRPRRR